MHVHSPGRHFRRTLVLLIAAWFLILVGGCGRGAPAALTGSAPTCSPLPGTPVYTYRVVSTWPHDRDAFTQGLVCVNGGLLESTGLYGRSSLRRVDLLTGRVLQQVTVPPEYFAEGLTALRGKLYQLSWQNQTGFVYDQATFRRQQEFSYAGEGWGLATDGQSLILSDGTDRIRFLNPATFAVERTISVSDHGRPVGRLNELEYVKGEIFANVWQTDFVVRINPATGAVTGWIDFSGLLSPADRDASTDVLNGIAWDAAGDRLFITGKFWPKLFEVRLEPKP
ncbi:MAG: glutaminyl-peptide cyclotransferase [Verrucomicrobiia bacterium]